MKIALLLFVAVNLADAGKCGLKYQTVTSKPCSHYISMTGINGREPLTEAEFAQLNPEVNCNQPVPEETEICLRSKRPCEVTTISAGRKSCIEYLRMTAIHGRKPFTKEQFMKKNRDIQCDNPAKDIIPDGLEICLRLQNPCGQIIRSEKEKSCRSYIKLSEKYGEKLTKAEFTKLNPTVSCNDLKTDTIGAGQEICVQKKKICQLSVRAQGNKPCQDYIELTTINGKDQLTPEQFAKLNPTIDCAKPIPHGKDVCLRLKRPCGLTVRAEKGKTCRDYIAMTEVGTRKRLTKNLLTEFDRLNPTINCSIPIGEGIEICLYSDSKFDDPDVQDGTTLEEFLASAQQTTQFDNNLYENLSGLVNQMNKRRRKREATDDLEKKVAEKLADPASISSIKSLIENNGNFKELDDEYQAWRTKVCEEMKTDDAYKTCVCDETKPFIHCQAILMKEKDEMVERAKRAASRAVNQIKSNFPNVTSVRQSRAIKNGLMKKASKFIKFLEEKGCSSLENCLTHECHSEEGCVPLPLPPPTPPFLEVCLNGEVCKPSKLNNALNFKPGYLPINQFTETKMSLKIGICLKQFKGLDILSWLGFEKCLASIIFEYYRFKSQLDISGQIALVAVRGTITAKVQIMKSFSEGYRGTPFYVRDGYKGDICKTTNHQCQDYCAMKPMDFGVGYKVEHWWWGWRTWKEASVKDAVPHCN